MHEESLTQNTKCVLESLDRTGTIKDFYLAGGTALALYYGHRFSVDLDWFAENFTYSPDFRKKISELGKLGVDYESEKTFNGVLNEVKISFLREKFIGIEYNETHLLKSIIYFEDAKKSEFPKMIKKVDWEEIKKRIVSVVKQYMA